MKPLIFIFVLCSLGTFSQNTEKYLIENLHNLSQNSKNFPVRASSISSSDKEKIFKKILDTSFAMTKVINQAVLPDSVSLSDTWDSTFIAQHYFIDIDKDNDVDVVFLGSHYIGSTEGNVDIYINKNEKYSKKLETKGKVTFAAAKIDSAYTLVIYHYPCCNKSDHTIDVYLCNKDKLTLSNSVTFIGDTPMNLKESGTIELPVNTTVISKLTGAPDQLGMTSKIIKTNYYAEQKDSQGTIWRYVKLQVKDLQNVKNGEWKAVLGWVK